MKPSAFCVRAGEHDVRLEGDSREFSVSLSAERLGDGLQLVRLDLHSEAPQKPRPLRLLFRHPSNGVFGRWHPAALHARHLPPDWAEPFTSELTRNAPVACLYGADGTNRLTFACSDTLNPLGLRVGVQEETAEIRCRVQLFERPHPAFRAYRLDLLLDTRPVPYHRALDHVQQWWRRMPGCSPRPVPEAARLPMYSTWYSFHQSVEPDAVLEQCRLSRELGCQAVIIDDGWQTLDSRRGYAYAGDWRPERIADMRRFVVDVHDIGMKLLLWYAMPFVGEKTELYGRFKDKMLTHFEQLQAGVLDPRYPEIREHLIGVLERALRDWDLDGFKLDFVDEFSPRRGQLPPARDGMDFVSVSEAAFRLMEDTFDRLHAIKPDVMVEFRQEYIGPVMRRFGNMFRAGDCPNDALSNRLRTLDIRLLCGETACHSDMLMWHPADRVESAALQVLAILFSVPQLSVRLDRLPPDHLAMLRFWMRFWRENRDVLLDGELQPQHPEMLYPAVVATSPGKRLVAVYQDTVAAAGPGVPEELLLINGTLGDRIVLDLAEDAGPRRLEVFDCIGNRAYGEVRAMRAGLHALSVPPAGVIRLRTER